MPFPLPEPLPSPLPLPAPFSMTTPLPSQAPLLVPLAVASSTVTPIHLSDIIVSWMGNTQTFPSPVVLSGSLTVTLSNESLETGSVIALSV